jgi:hypothetical protein
MNKDMHGKLIEYIELEPAWTQHGNPERVIPPTGQTLRLSVTYHGDHDEVWIVLSEGDVELARYNPAGVNHIRWSTQRT